MIKIKILLAMDNKEIKTRLDKKYGNRVYSHDICCMENVIEFLSRKTEPFLVITKDSLQGNIDKKLYIKQIRLANEKSKIVYIVDKLTQDYKEFLFANEVFNIIEGRNINFDVLTSFVDNPKSIVYRNIDSIKTNEKKTKIIGVFGIPGIGKTVTSTIIARDLKARGRENTILIDMNMKGASIDILNNIDSNNNAFYEYIDGDISLINVVVRKQDLSYIVNKPNNNIQFNRKKLDALYSFILKNYSYVVLDMSPDFNDEYAKYWLDKITDVFVVVKPNYLDIRKTMRYLDEFKGENVSLVINEIKRGSLEESQVSSLFSGYKIIGSIYYSKNLECYINGATADTGVDYDFSKMYKEFNIQNKVNITSYIETYKRFRESLERI